ncbi:RNA polymerase sigma-70 factor, ECF subfamily [Zhouia amylolytica]|uniref:RNA polymerase sigma-70 factor, ECF subfamily n=1 Tax=Zhouia amylolytica TaxID=376730 RepID=A0A1I6RHZ5_9FLAO|nr:RNA polymerase sigma factor [Zhouia amylolytica]SFS64337.1 RNA polymerase sigma-70 factor, ECF subfamily [Zhouia amylolytica]
MKQILKVIQLHTNENKLIKRSIRGDREAQHKLYVRYAPKMLSVCRFYIKDIHFAEDTMIQAFCKVFTNLESYRNEGSFEGWIRKIMIRECLSFLRSKNRVLFLENESIYSDSECVQDNYQQLIDAEHIQLMIDALPDGYKMVFLLFAVEGYSHKEIAEKLAIKESTSKSQLFKARKMLQERINEFKNQEYETQSS